MMYQKPWNEGMHRSETDLYGPEILDVRQFKDKTRGTFRVILNDEVSEFLDKWNQTSTNCDEQKRNLRSVCLALKSCYTYVQQATTKPKSAYHKQYTWIPQHEQYQQKRIDLIRTKKNNELVLRRAARNRKQKVLRLPSNLSNTSSNFRTLQKKV